MVRVNGGSEDMSLRTRMKSSAHPTASAQGKHVGMRASTAPSERMCTCTTVLPCPELTRMSCSFVSLKTSKLYSKSDVKLCNAGSRIDPSIDPPPSPLP